MKRLMFALVGAVALVGVASAEPTVSPWFSTGIKDYTTWDAVEEADGAWANTEGGEIVGEEGAKTIALDADADAPLKFAVTNGKTVGEKVASVSVKSEIVFTPFTEAAVADMEVPSDAKGGVIVVKDSSDALSYYVLAQDADATETPANKWTATGIAATADDPVLVTITVSAGTVSGIQKITYTFGSVSTETYDIVMSGEITTANYTGCGTIASLSGEQVAAMFDLDFGTLPTGVDSVTVTVDGETLTPVSGNKYEIANGKTAVATFAPVTGYLLNAAEIQVTPTADITYTAEDFPVAANEIVAYIGETAYTNLQEAANNVPNGGTVKIANDHVALNVELFFVNKANVLFDLGGYTVTSTEGNHSLAVFGGSVTITNGVWYKTVNSTAVIVGKTATDGSYEPSATRGSPYTDYSGQAYAGQLTIAAGATLKGTTGANVIKANNGASVIVDGGTLTSVGPEKQVAIKAAGAGTTATIKAGVIDGALSEDAGTITIIAESAKAADSTFVADYTAMLDSQSYKMEEQDGIWKIVDNQAGPTPAPGSDATVDPVAGEANTYAVTAKADSGVVALQNVKSGDTLVINSTNVNMIATELGFDGVTIRIMGRDSSVVLDPAVFVGLTDGNKFDVTLNPTATVTVDEVEIPVKPTIGDGLVTDPFVVGDDVSVTVAAIPGLTYSLVRTESLAAGATKTTVAEAAATTTSVTLTDDSETKPSTAFYVIEVTK